MSDFGDFEAAKVETATGTDLGDFAAAKTVAAPEPDLGDFSAARVASPSPLTDQAVAQTKSFTDVLKTPSPQWLQPFEAGVRHNVEQIKEHPFKTLLSLVDVRDIPQLPDNLRKDYQNWKAASNGQPLPNPEAAKPIGTKEYGDWIHSQQFWDELTGNALMVLGGEAIGPAIRPLFRRSAETPKPETATPTQPGVETQPQATTEGVRPTPEVTQTVSEPIKGGETVASEVPKNEVSNGETVRQEERPASSSSNVEQASQGETVSGPGPQVATVPPEQPTDLPRVTSIKNEVVDQERVQRGLAPAMEEGRKSFGTTWDQAMAELEKNPERPAELVDELKQKPRALNDQEDALLLHRQIDLQNQFAKNAQELIAAKDSGNTGMVDELNLRNANLSDQLLDVYNTGKGAGTETGRGLNARKMLAAEDYSLASMITKKRAALKGEQLTPEQVSEVGKAHENIKAAQLSLDQYEAKRLAAFKKRTAKRIGELEAKTVAGDFTRKQRAPIQLDAEGLKLRANLERAKLEFEKGLTKDRLSNRTTWEKALDGIAKWRRTFVLTWPTVLAKLTTASGELIGITPVEEAVRTGVTKVLPKAVTEKASRYGAGLNIKTEVGAITHTFRTLFKSAGQKFKTGNSDIDLLYGKPDVLPVELKDYISNLHGALKEPARQNEFFRSFEQIANSYARKGVDVTDPLVQTKIGFDAYKRANEQIFMEKNMAADALQRGLSRFGEINKQTGKPSMIGKAAQTGVRFELPIIRIPLNIVKRTFEYSFGTAAGSFRLARAVVNGLEKLKPEESDIIVRNFSRGTVGLGLVALGYFNPETVGGYYQTGEKRGKDEPQAGGIRLGSHNIPRLVLHNPALEQIQIGATIRRVADSKLRKKDVDPQGYANGVMAAYSGLIEEVPFIQQAERSLKALNPHERKQFLGELMRSAIPGVVEWAARMMDLENGQIVPRKPETAIDYPKAAIPGLRQQVPVRTENRSRQSSSSETVVP